MLDCGADVLWCSVCGCLLTQQHVELDARDAAGGALAYGAQMPAMPKGTTVLDLVLRGTGEHDALERRMRELEARMATGDEAALLDLAKRTGGRILVVEDNQGAPIAGAVSEACTASGNGFTLESMCVRAPTVVARTFAEALVEARLSAADIVARASRMVGLGA